MLSSTEVRWFLVPEAGLLERLEAAFRGAVPAQGGSVPVDWSPERVDRYLILDPESEDAGAMDAPAEGLLGIKLRDASGSSSRLEVKGLTGIHGDTVFLPGATGSVESWMKWSFPQAASTGFARLLGDPHHTRAVAKRRLLRMFAIERDGGLAEVDVTVPRPPLISGISAELTRIRRPDCAGAAGDVAWTIGFEAFPSGADTRSVLAAFCARFLTGLAGMVPLDPDDSLSYPGWLSRQPPGDGMAGEE